MSHRTPSPASPRGASTGDVFIPQGMCLYPTGDVFVPWEEQAGPRCLLEGDQQRELGGSQVQTPGMAFSARAGDRNPGKGPQDRDARLQEALETRGTSQHPHSGPKRCNSFVPYLGKLFFKKFISQWERRLRQNQSN